jgi:hypothetical protein
VFACQWRLTWCPGLKSGACQQGWWGCLDASTVHDVFTIAKGAAAVTGITREPTGYLTRRNTGTTSFKELVVKATSRRYLAPLVPPAAVNVVAWLLTATLVIVILFGVGVTVAPTRASPGISARYCVNPTYTAWTQPGPLGCRTRTVR